MQRCRTADNVRTTRLYGGTGPGNILFLSDTRLYRDAAICAVVKTSHKPSTESAPSCQFYDCEVIRTAPHVVRQETWLLRLRDYLYTKDANPIRQRPLNALLMLEKNYRQNIQLWLAKFRPIFDLTLSFNDFCCKHPHLSLLTNY